MSSDVPEVRRLLKALAHKVNDTLAEQGGDTGRAGNQEAVHPLSASENTGKATPSLTFLSGQHIGNALW